MSRIDELIARLCPNGVALKTLGNVGEFFRGNGLQKSDLTDAGTPAIHYGQIHTLYGVWTETTKSFTDPILAAKLRRAQPGDLVVATTSEDDAAVAKATAWVGQCEAVVSGDAYIYRHTLDARYVSYFFQSQSFQTQKIRFITGAKVRRISGDALSKIRVPVPPLEVQREIVRILDQFTQLEAELEAELEARRRQYEHYRHELLMDDGAEYSRTRLDQLFDLRAGSFIAASEIVPASEPTHPVPCFGGGGLRGYVASPNQQGDLVLIGRQGALCGNVRRASGEFYATEHSVVVTPHDGVDIRWAFHLLTGMNLNQYASKSAQPGLAVGTLNQLLVDVPSLDEQLRIGSVLDKFDALVNDLSSGLPAELAARRKQYEYYRDKLLTFKEAGHE